MSLGERNYSIAICKGAALLDETRMLLKDWHQGESVDTFVKRVQQEGILANSTAYRTRDIVRRVFVPRYLRPNDQPARILQAVLGSNLEHRVFPELVLLFAAKNDRLIRDFIVREFWQALWRGRIGIDVPLVLSFFSEAIADGRIVNPWSDSVSKKVARGILGFLREVGFLRKVRRSIREIENYRLSDNGLVIIAKYLHESGTTNSAICMHEDWHLFGLDESSVYARLDLLGEEYGLLLQRAGSVFAMNWMVHSTIELISFLGNRCSKSRGLP